VAPANGAADAAAASTLAAEVSAAGRRLKRWPAMSAMSATRAMPATAHGKLDEKLR
jgi:hypothetical protein